MMADAYIASRDFNNATNELNKVLQHN
jgi:tetratricopeptide repeat protein 21B